MSQVLKPSEVQKKTKYKYKTPYYTAVQYQR